MYMIRVSIKRRATDSDRYTSAYVIHNKQCMPICLSFAGKVKLNSNNLQSLDDVSDAEGYCYSCKLETLQQFDTPLRGNASLGTSLYHFRNLCQNSSDPSQLNEKPLQESKDRTHTRLFTGPLQDPTGSPIDRKDTICYHAGI